MAAAAFAAARTSAPRQARRAPEAATGGDREAGPAQRVGRARRAEGAHRPATAQAPDPVREPDPAPESDPASAADAAATENLLRCWVRETGLPRPHGDSLRIVLTACQLVLRVPVRYWSATGWHRFGRPVLEHRPPRTPPLDAVTLAALLGREAACGTPAARRPPVGAAGAGAAPAAGRAAVVAGAAHTAAVRRPEPAAPRGASAAPGAQAELVGRVADSARRVTGFLTERRAAPTAAEEAGEFLAAEQSLVFGHPFHPTPKSREGITETEARDFSPELRGRFPLHWLAVDRAVLAGESAWTERGRPVPAERLVRSLCEDLPALPDGTVPLPLHPWQARELRLRPEAAALFDAGMLRDLGPHGPSWYPTSSVRTVYRSTAPAMLKLSLGVRITNSRRENLRKELHRGVEVHRLLRAGLFTRWRAACPQGPGFDIVRDPAWLAVDAPDGTPLAGVDVVIRHNPFGPADRAVCLAGLVSPVPPPGGGEPRSRLARLIEGLTARTGRPRQAVATEWFLRYLRAVLTPLLWLDGEAGIALEAHQQNTVVLLDPEGWPAGGRYRDNQGYYFRESARDRLARSLPGIGERSDTFVPDPVADERFAYYLGVNNVLGLIGAFGSQRLADEAVLLAAFRRFLGQAAGSSAGGASTLPDRLLTEPTLRCKANLLTRLHGLDELVGPVDTQSVYVTIANPLAGDAC
ncbi:iron transporter [Streptomyces palmae]|uniref:Iron transporter n=1 Tax=Streptomyces palmae TaxID=1701085 RepID=A0A4Z0H6C2_9ACTN|nr:iron transporter [Streptomyces palmae]